MSKLGFSFFNLPITFFNSLRSFFISNKILYKISLSLEKSLEFESLSISAGKLLIGLGR